MAEHPRNEISRFLLQAVQLYGATFAVLILLSGIIPDAAFSAGQGWRRLKWAGLCAIPISLVSAYLSGPVSPFSKWRRILPLLVSLAWSLLFVVAIRLFCFFR